MIEFTSENRPVCRPTTQPQCDLNVGASQDMYDALSCFQTQGIYSGCTILEDSIAKEDVETDIELTLLKSTYGTSIDVCNWDIFVNGSATLDIDAAFSGSGEYSKVRITDLNDDEIQIAISPGSIAIADASDYYVYKIVVRKYTTFIDRVNECEPEINCRDIE